MRKSLSLSWFTFSDGRAVGVMLVTVMMMLHTHISTTCSIYIRIFCVHKRIQHLSLWARAHAQTHFCPQHETIKLSEHWQNWANAAYISIFHAVHRSNWVLWYYNVMSDDKKTRRCRCRTMFLSNRVRLSLSLRACFCYSVLCVCVVYFENCHWQKIVGVDETPERRKTEKREEECEKMARSTTHNTSSSMFHRNVSRLEN